MKRKNFLDRRAYAIVQLESNSGLRLLLAAFQFKPQLDKEELLKNQSDVGRCSERLQFLHA